MSEVLLSLPADSLTGVRIPPNEPQMELRRRLAVSLFSDGLLPGAAACKMAGMGKAEFQNMLGERGVTQPLEISELEEEIANMKLVPEAGPVAPELPNPFFSRVLLPGFASLQANLSGGVDSSDAISQMREQR